MFNNMASLPHRADDAPEEFGIDSQVLKAEFLQNTDFCDATVRCKGQTWPVHKVKLAEKSDYFKNAFSSKRGFAEAKNHDVDLSDSEEPESIARLLTWIYKREDVLYLPDQRFPYPHYSRSSINWHLDLMRLADYFAIPDLFANSSGQITACLSQNCMSLSHTEPHSFSAGVSMSSFCDIGRYVAQYPNKLVRGVWAAAAAGNWAELQIFDIGQEFRDCIGAYPELCVAVLNVLHADEKYQEKFVNAQQRFYAPHWEERPGPVLQARKKG